MYFETATKQTTERQYLRFPLTLYSEPNNQIHKEPMQYAQWTWTVTVYTVRVENSTTQQSTLQHSTAQHRRKL